MPLYEYKCPKCRRIMTELQKHNDLAPYCFCDKGTPIEMVKQMSLGSFRLKGTGWCRDGYDKPKK